MRRKFCICFAIAILCGCFTSTVYAMPQTYNADRNYEYNSYEESVEAPSGYTACRQMTGEAMGTTALASPQDMFVTAAGDFYILDSGNGRILVTDSALRVQREITRFTYRGAPVTFQGAKGMFLCADGTLYLADTEGERVLVIDPDGQVTAVIEKPDSDLLDAQIPFAATKVMHDGNGITYVLVNGITDGALSFDEDYNFIGFYGSNRIRPTAEVVADYLWSKFMTKEQISGSKGRIPAQFSNFDIDSDQFIYTVTATNDSSGNFRKLNFKGSDLLELKQYGDIELDGIVADEKVTGMVDVDVDGDGFVNLLDQTMGRIFQYSDAGDLVTIFGGMGSQLGTFQSPVALESYRGSVYVLDSIQNTVTVFEPTAYTLAKRQAIMLFDQGDYAGSVEYWNTVLSMNTNSEMAYGGIAKAYEEAAEYEKAMEYYRMANQREGYSTAYREVRKVVLKKWFGALFAGVIVLVAGLIVLWQVRKRRRVSLEALGALPPISKAKAPFYMALHPVDCCDEFLKRRKRGSYTAVLIILASLFVILSLSWFLTGFLFNTHQPKDYKVVITVVQAFGIVFVWCVANWAVCTLVEGKGTFKEIICATTYGLIPFVISLYVKLVMSNVLTLSESGFMTLVVAFGALWSLALILVGLATVHQFSLWKTVASVVLTLLFIAIMLFILTLFYGLLQQVASFVELIYSEIQMMQ